MNQRRPIVFLLITTTIPFMAGCTELATTPVRSPDGTMTTIYLVRHAEREPGLDPPLNEEGIARAAALADVLQDAGVTAIFCPALIRNQETCDDVAEVSGAEIITVGAVELGDTRALANNFVNDVITDHAGGVVLWVGNTGPVVQEQSGNLQEIYNRLGGTGNPPIRYQDIYTVNIFDDRDPEISEGEYGGPSSLD